MMSNRAYFSHLKLFKFNILSKRTKMKLYKTLIRPFVTYGAETWTIKLADEQHLRVFERKINSRIYGPVFIDGEWKRRYNKEIDELLGHENIVGFIKALKIRLLGNIERMSEERVPKMILNSNYHSGRRRGRPMKRWIDDLESDLRSLGIRNWKAKARNRNEWKAVVRDAKVHSTGL